MTLKSRNPISLFIPKVNPVLKENINSILVKDRKQITKLKNSFNEEHIAIHGKVFDSMIEDMQDILEKIENILKSVKSYTKEGIEGFLEIQGILNSFDNKIENLIVNYQEKSKEIYLLSILSAFADAKNQLEIVLHKIEKSPFKQLLLTLVGYIFVFIPFINIFSMFIGLHLVTQKDYRAGLLGWIMLASFIIQMLSIFSLAF